MKKFLLILTTPFILSACTKINADSIENVHQKTTALSGSAAQAVYNNPFGVFAYKANGIELSGSQEVNLSHDLGVAYARLSLGNKTWNSLTSRINFLNTYKLYAQQKPAINILLNLNYSGDETGAVPFPGATPDYKKFIKSVTDVLTSPGYVPPALIVIENEENNSNKHEINGFADQQKYIDMLKSSADECHSKGLKIANGGLTHLAVISLVYNYYATTLHEPDSAAAFLKICWPSTFIDYWRSNPDSAKKIIARAKYYMDRYKHLDLDYLNIHWYEPIKAAYASKDTPPQELDTVNLNPECFETVERYFSDPKITNKKPLGTNETGQVTTSVVLPEQITCLMKDLPFVVYFSGDRPPGQNPQNTFGQYALHTAYATGAVRYTLRETGIAYRDNIAAIVANPYTYCESKF